MRSPLAAVPVLTRIAFLILPALLCGTGKSYASELGRASVSASEASAIFSRKRRPNTNACSAARAHLKDGDLIFLELSNFLYKRVAAASNSWASHVGVAFYDPKTDSWSVTESKPLRGRKTPLCTFIRHAHNSHFAITRLRGGLTPKQLNRVRRFTEIRSEYRKLYHLGFKLDSTETTFCSKYARDAYAKAGIELGKIETFRDMLDAFQGDAAGRRAVIKFFDSWFACRKLFGSACSLIGGDRNANTPIPWDRKTVTPASQLTDPKFKVVYEHGS